MNIRKKKKTNDSTIIVHKMKKKMNEYQEKKTNDSATIVHNKKKKKTDDFTTIV